MATGCVIGVDLGGTKLLAGAVDPALNVHHRATRPARARDHNAVLDTVVSAVEEVRDAIEGGTGSVEAVGIGIPALIDTERGMAVMSTHLPLGGVQFAALVTERIGLPVFVDNDANAAMLAEWRFGAARGARDAALLTIGTGIGGGLVARRRAAARFAGRGRRARPHGRPGRRAALQRQLPQPRLPGIGLLGHGAGARGAADRRGAPASRASARRSPPGARSAACSSPSSPTTAIRRRSTRSRRWGAGWGSASATS